MASLCAQCIIYYPSVSPHAASFSSKSIEGTQSFRVPIYFTWVERDDCGENALSRGIRNQRNSNPRTLTYESRARTDTSQCSVPLYYKV